MKLRNIINIIFNVIIACFTIINLVTNKGLYPTIFSLIISLLVFSMFILNLIANIKGYSTIIKTSIIVNIGLCTFTLLYVTLYNSKILYMFSSIELMKQFILSTKEKGIFIYILIQVLQVVFVPIPAAVIAIVGSIIYGPILGAIYCTIGILLGSYISYGIGKTFGFKIVSWVVGYDNAIKYSNIIANRGIFFLSIAFLLPLFPDDILCLVAGISTMKFTTFFIITTITRPVGVLFMCVFGSGQIIPYSGWGLVVWGIIIIVAISIIILMYKYQDRLQSWILSKIKATNSSTKISF